MFMNNTGLHLQTYNEFGYNEHPAIISRFLCIKITESNVKKFGLQLAYICTRGT